MVGGEYRRTNILLWKGNMSVPGFQIQFNPIKHTIPANAESVDGNVVRNRLSPLCFRLRNNLYIAGGLVFLDNEQNCADLRATKHHKFCDKFDIKEEKLYPSQYKLPCYITKSDKVATDAEETFAIILKRGPDGSWDADEEGAIIVFTEDVGFSKVSCLKISGRNPFVVNKKLRMRAMESDGNQNLTLIRI